MSTSLDPLTTALRAFAPDVVPPGPLAGDVSFVVHDTAIGRMLLAARPDGAALASSFVTSGAQVDAVLSRLSRLVSPRVVRGGDGVQRLVDELDAFVAGVTTGFTVPVDLTLASPFQRAVLTRLGADVGYGDRTTYGALAASLGRPTASRAVGAALGANPLCVVLPCHRVVASSGALTGYAGGLAAKQRLLNLESGALPASGSTGRQG